MAGGVCATGTTAPTCTCTCTSAIPIPVNLQVIVSTGTAHGYVGQYLRWVYLRVCGKVRQQQCNNHTIMVVTLSSLLSCGTRQQGWGWQWGWQWQHDNHAITVDMSLLSLSGKTRWEGEARGMCQWVRVKGEGGQWWWWHDDHTIAVVTSLLSSPSCGTRCYNTRYQPPFFYHSSSSVVFWLAFNLHHFGYVLSKQLPVHHMVILFISLLSFPTWTLTNTVTVQGLDLIFSITHLSPLSSDCLFMFTISIMFLPDVYQYTIW